MDYNQDITTIKGIGEKSRDNLARIGIFRVGDLIEHYPKNYEVLESVIPIANVEEGNIVTIYASVSNHAELLKRHNLNILNCYAKDPSGSIKLTWFNMPFLKSRLKIGLKAIFRGKAVFKNGVMVLDQPKILTEQEYHQQLNQLQPVYSLTKGVTNHFMFKAMNQVLDNLEDSEDYLPAKIRKKYDLISHKKAIRGVHVPKDKEDIITARRRIVFDEFFIFALALEQLKTQNIIEENRFMMKIPEECDTLISRLPYSLTSAQKKVWIDIKRDMNSNRTMNRLIQGDVGSGKTIVAALALLMCVMNGYQGTLMVPTEVLAKQHFSLITELFDPFGLKVICLTGSMTAKEKRIAYQLIESHQADVIIGTHALIVEKVNYHNLGLVITDEQHRFGVRQRELHSEKGEKPHILVMSATPIPRTLAIILYGDLDVSIIDELPANRLPIKNCVVNTSFRPNAYQFIQKEVQKGRQAYVICPMVEESDMIEAENVIEYTETLKECFDSAIRVEYLHGKMKPSMKQKIMSEFTEGKIQVLVSTTVIEVGINVPNATVMMIENAERFGLAQLHQLRGRVGRGVEQSYCILINGSSSKESKERLEILNKSNDGFFIANEDLKLRGPGDLFGIRQSGEIKFKLADIFQDSKIMQQAYEAIKLFSLEERNDLIKSNLLLNQKMSFYTLSGNYHL